MPASQRVSVDVFDDTRCELGEGPAWDPRAREVSWVDIDAGKVLVKGLAGSVRVITTPAPVGAALRRRDGGYLLNLEHGPALLDEDGSVIMRGTFREADQRPPSRAVRGNDAKCDPAGRAFLGTMEYTESDAAGALYRLDPDAQAPVLVEPGAMVSNGLGWSPDATLMYYVDSPTRRIDVFDYEIETGQVSARRPFVHIEDGAGFPDGLCVDAEGGVWIALWGGAGLRRYTAAATLDQFIELPCSQVTSCAFVGVDLDRLVVTSAWSGLPAPPETAGMTYTFEPGVPGLPVAAFGTSSATGTGVAYWTRSAASSRRSFRQCQAAHRSCEACCSMLRASPERNRAAWSCEYSNEPTRLEALSSGRSSRLRMR